MAKLKFTYRSAGKVGDGRPDRHETFHDRKKIMVNGKPVSPNMAPKDHKLLQDWALSKGFAIVSLYNEVKRGRSATWARTEPVALPTRKLAT